VAQVKVGGSAAIVTGGASGLGYGTAERLIQGGGSVVVFDMNEALGADAAGRLGAAARFIHCDVRDPGSVSAAVARSAEELGRIDLLVNAAGVAPAQRLVSRDGELFDLDLFKFVIDVNLVGAFDVARNVAGVMVRNEPDATGERGVIVNVASIAAFEGQIGQTAYAASKGAIAAMTLPMARDLGTAGIRVVAIAPGIMDTPLLSSAPQELKESLAGLHVFPHRLGTPADFAHLVVAVMENPLLNGEVIRLDAAARMPPR
jgi:3-hydroxyacyl-CoA dehydrogenase/3-hydroxy-2-methylbutyryl-CoA dehydrogenase